MNRKALAEKLKNVVWAAIFAIALWLVMVQSEQQTSEVEAILQVTAPAGVNVKYNTPNNRPPVERVLVRGSANSLARQEKKVDAVYKVPEGTEMGPKTYAVRDFEFRLSPGVEVDKSSLTQELQVVLAKRKSEQLPIKLVLDGDPPEGWEIVDEETHVEPRTIEASGSIEEMDRGPELKTDRLPLAKVLDRLGFNARKRVPQEFEYPVAVLAPEKSGINIEARPVTARLKLRPKPMQRDDIFIAPAFHFDGPAFDGFPYKLTLLAGQPDKVRIKVSGPESDLLDTAVEATKSSFVVFVRVPANLATEGKLEAGGRGAFEVVVIPPAGVKVLDYDPKLLRFSIDPIAAGAPPK